MDVNKLLRTAPVKEEFAPTLPQLLAPRIDSLPRIVLRIIAAARSWSRSAVILLALRLRDPVFSYAGPPAFSTSYPRAMTTRTHTTRGAAAARAALEHRPRGLARDHATEAARLPGRDQRASCR